jgi:uncharacterized protein YqeY
MALRERLDADMKTAMRGQDRLRLDTIRMIKSSIKYKETEPGATGPLDDAGIERVLASEVKKRRDAIAEYEKAQRQDLADKERAELGVIQSYLPEPMDEAALAQAVEETIREVGAQSPKDMGAVMKALGPKIQGRADGKAAADLVKQKLSS